MDTTPGPLPSLYGLAFAEFRDLARQSFLSGDRPAKGSGLARGIYAQAMATGRISPQELGASDATARRYASLVDSRLPLALEQELADDGPDTGARKAIWRLADGQHIETVLIPMAGGDGKKASLCLSTQVGCAMACRFCETGRMGWQRQLSAAEIVAQVVAARQIPRWDFGNLVLMGMGEALDNFANLAQALAILFDPAGLAFAQERVTVCTVGHIPGIRALKALGYKRLGLALSLNAATQAERAALMPAARDWPLDELLDTLADYPQRRNFVLAINWCLLPGQNDRPCDLDALTVIARCLGRVMVNVIPYNPGSQPLAPAPAPADIERFLQALAQRSIPARCRLPRGRSIMAACGQLGNMHQTPSRPRG